MRKTKAKGRISRRKFLEGTGVAVVAATAAPAIQAQSPTVAGPDPAVPRTKIRLTVNGKSQQVEVEDRWTLVEVIARSPALPAPRSAATGASAALAPC